MEIALGVFKNLSRGNVAESTSRFGRPGILHGKHALFICYSAFGSNTIKRIIRQRRKGLSKFTTPTATTIRSDYFTEEIIALFAVGGR
jgi:hypothetical protein